jgi:hypothetical protein
MMRCDSTACAGGSPVGAASTRCEPDLNVQEKRLVVFRHIVGFRREIDGATISVDQIAVLSVCFVSVVDDRVLRVAFLVFVRPRAR